MEKSKDIVNTWKNTLLAPVIECSSPPCYAHEVDPVYMGIMQAEQQSHDVSAIETLTSCESGARVARETVKLPQPAQPG